MKHPIYIDLDECLIHTILSRGSKKRRIQMSLGGETYNAQLRPAAKEMLRSLRSTGNEVRLLTTATKEYALAANKLFDLGFAEEQITAREDYIYEINTGYRRHPNVGKTSASPQSVLIDNENPEMENARLKRAHLGIPKENYIQIREYHGGKDPAKFHQEWSEIAKRVGATPSSPSTLGIKIDKHTIEQEIL